MFAGRVHVDVPLQQQSNHFRVAVLGRYVKRTETSLSHTHAHTLVHRPSFCIVLTRKQRTFIDKNSSGDEIANVNFYAVRPQATRIR